ncbi:MAG: hypothetical protein HC857_11235 [Synechococcales cyanobacterium RU_4_20]|nr:hypothetical protein [Synechococcales cyanobacterium RU_4_20]
MRQHSGHLIHQVVEEFEFEARLNGWFGRPEIVSQQILTWTEGQPFLTHRLFQVVLRSLRHRTQRSLQEFQFLSAAFRSKHPQRSDYPPEAEWLDRLVQHQCVDRCTDLELRKHLRKLCRTILADPSLVQLLQTYQQVLQGDRLSCDRLSSAKLRLIQTGLVRPSQGELVLGNRLYPAIFNQTWLNRAFRKVSPPRASSRLAPQAWPKASPQASRPDSPQALPETATAALDQLLARNRRIGRNVSRSAMIAALHAAGVQNVNLIEPVADVFIEATQVASVGTINVTIAGFDE